MTRFRRWADIERVLNSQLHRLECGYIKLKDWDRKATEMDKWMDQVTDFVHAEQPAVGNLETLKAQLEQSQVRRVFFCFDPSKMRNFFFR